MTYCKVPCQHLPATVSENMANLSSWSSDKYPDPGPSEYETKVSLLIFLDLIITPVRLLTYSMVQSPSWEANWFAASQEIPRILWNPKVHYRTHKRPPHVPILSQPNPVHTPTSHLPEIHRNIIHPSTPRSTQWSLSLWFPHQDPIRPPLLPHTRHMPCPSHSSRFYHLTPVRLRL